MSRRPSSTPSTPSLGRRDVLRLGGAALAVGLLDGCGPESTPPPECAVPPTDDGGVTGADPAALSASEETFPLGVQSGAVTGTSAVLWSFAADGASKRLVVWRGAGADTRIVREVEVEARDGYLKAEVTQLSPDHAYRYAFVDASGRSTIGAFRTAPDAECLRPLRIAATSCTNMRFAPFPALSTMAAREVDLICHLGDFAYNDGARTRAEFRDKWRAVLATEGYRDLLPKAPLVATWDDHEFDDNSRYYGRTPDELAIARDAWFEHLPVPRDRADRVWRSQRWGKTAELIVLDSRSERQPDTRGSDDPIYLSKEQLAWAIERLQTSDAHFKVVLNSVPISTFPGFWQAAAADRWEGYARQRDQLLDAITASGVRNVWFLSGDFHVGSVQRVEPEGPRARLWEVLCGPGGNVNPLVDIALADDTGELRKDVMPEGRFEFMRGSSTATFLTFDPIADAVEITFADPRTGETLFTTTLRDPPDEEA